MDKQIGRPIKDKEDLRDPGKTIESKRLSCDWSRKELSEKSGLSAASITRIINSEQNWTWEALEKIAEALNCKPSDFFSDDPGLFFRRILEATPKQQQLILSYADFVISSPISKE